MPRGFQIGRLFRTDIFATPGFLLLLGAYFFLLGLGASAAVLCIGLIVSLLVHEFGHVFAVRWFTGGDSRVVLWGLGGLCVHQPVRSPRKRIGISLMGPAFGFVLGAAAFVLQMAVGPASGLLANFLASLVWINVIWTFANLLPIVPLDGGQALRAALETRLSYPAAMRITRNVSVVTAIAAAALAISLGYPVAAAVAGLLIMQNLAPPSST